MVDYFCIEIEHSGLHKHRVIRGNDRHTVEAAARAQLRAWAEQYARKVATAERQSEREDKRRELEDGTKEAAQLTEEAQTALEGLRGILTATLKVDDTVDWESLMQPPFAQSQPAERAYVSLPPEPIFDSLEWKKRNHFVTTVIPFLAKRAESASRAEFATAHAKWSKRNVAAGVTNEKIYAENLRNYEDWLQRRNAYEEARASHNDSIANSRTKYQELNPDAILDYCDLVLSRSQYPDCLPKEFELDYRTSSKTLIVEYLLPAPQDLPRLESVKFSKLKGDFVETELPKRQQDQLYSDVAFQIALRTIHELFEADTVRALETVVFNGKVFALNSGTGHNENRCILSVRAARAVFEAINLRKIDVRACFESLGGIAGTKVSDCRAVQPLDSVDRSGQRFNTAQDLSRNTVSGLDEWHELVKGISDHADVRFLPLSTVAMLLGFPAQDKYSMPLSRELAQTVAARGFGMEPDARYGAASYRAAEEIALFRPMASPVTTAYPGAAALLQLCVMIAAADDHPTDEELRVARNFIRQHTTLTSQEEQRLLVLEYCLCRNPELATRSLSRLAKCLPPEQRHKVGELLVRVAGADGVITSAEGKALGHSWKVLGLAPDHLTEILRSLGAREVEPLVQEAIQAKPGEPIPQPEAEPAIPAFKLDMSRVAAISHETSEVIQMLSKVMSDDETKPSPPPKVEPPSSPATDNAEGWLAELAPKYHAVLLRLATRSAWLPVEFQQLAAEFNLMPLGMRDALNEWSDEALGDFLLDGEDPIIVNHSILPKHP
jgi:restriction system protein